MQNPAALDPPDLRLVLPALTTWLVAAAGLGLSVPLDLAGAGLLLVGACVVSRRVGAAGAAVVLALAGAALAVSALRLAAVDAGPVTDWARQRAVVTAEATVLSDPMPRDGPFGPQVLTEVRLEQVRGRGRSYAVRSPVLVIAGDEWAAVESGHRVRLRGRLDRSDSRDLAALVIARGPPEVVSAPGPVARAVNALRRGLRDSVSGLPEAERALVPALVVGDDRGMPEQLADDFRATGLTHLLAVSGANLTLLLAFVLPVVRWAGVRARGLAVTGIGVVVFFVLLARPDPSVLRAAAMGVVAMAGLGAGGRRRGTRALCVAVLVLVLLDPWLARSVGFVLSVLATAAIVVLAPPWRDALARWAPRWLAEAVAVPAAAQLACTPVVVAISGQVSLVAVGANLLAAPAVGPATVMGLLAALLSVLSDRLASVAGWLAGGAAWWIVTVAEHGADLPGAAVPWPATGPAVAAITAVCVLCAVAAPRVLTHRTRCLAVAVVSVVAVLRPVQGVGWPPDGWVLTMCDVGQGDALVLNAGGGAGVVVDTGPDPGAVDACLDLLEIEQVPMVLLTHLHADHAGGLAGVFEGRRVGEVVIGPLTSPAEQHRAVTRLAARHRVRLRTGVPGEVGRLGLLRWSVLGPLGREPLSAAGDPTGESSAENDASLVLRVESDPLSLLLTGDVEPPGQRALLASGADLDVDVLKVPHHGSRHQDADFLAATSPAVALVSSGAGNDYGHPAGDTLRLLRSLHVRTLRTDRDGTVAVVPTPTGPAVVTGGEP
ncbi:MAG: DNA internalization-related competence protein ComEC/Rec2 [Nocardioidaceae bacterium]